MLEEVRLGFVVKPAQLECVVEKVWGHEEWIVNDNKYCGKKMVFRGGYQCSWHHHRIKQETFYLQSGRLVLETEESGAYASRILHPGDVAHVLPFVWHRLSAIENSELFEFSTLHMEEDSYRRTASGKADFKAMGIIL